MTLFFCGRLGVMADIGRMPPVLIDERPIQVLRIGFGRQLNAVVGSVNRRH